MGAEKLYSDTIKDTTKPIKGELVIGGESFSYDYYLLPIVSKVKAAVKKTKEALIKRIGNQIQNGKNCLDIDEKLVRENLKNDEYSAIVFVKNKNHDDNASGTMQSYNWCESGSESNQNQMWVNDLCRISSEKREVSPIKALIRVFEMITLKYTQNDKYIYLMVDKEVPAQAEILKNIYLKYGFEVASDCSLEEGDEYIVMRKPLGVASSSSDAKKTKRTVKKSLSIKRNHKDSRKSSKIGIRSI